MGDERRQGRTDIGTDHEIGDVVEVGRVAIENHEPRAVSLGYKTDRYKLLAKVQTAIGARTAGYFGKVRKGFDRFYLAVPSRAAHNAGG